MKSKDCVGTFLSKIVKYPLLSKEQETISAQKYQRYREIEKFKDDLSEASNPKLFEYTRILRVKHQEVLRRGTKISMQAWADCTNLTVDQVKEILFTGRSYWASLAGITVEEITIIEREGLLAKDLLLKSNIRLAVSIAKRYSNSGIELPDLIQEGIIGLNRAIKTFDVRKGYRFSTYAYPWVKQAINRAIEKTGKEIRLPNHILGSMSKIRKAINILLANDQQITITAIGEITKKDPEEIKHIITSNLKVLSLDVKVGENETSTWIDILESPLSTPSQILEANSIVETALNILNELTEKEKEVIILRYGLRGDVQSLSAIGETFNLSAERIRQIERNGMKKLRYRAKKYQEVRQLLG